MNSQYLWFKGFIAAGLLLSVLLLVESLVTYRYVRRDLVSEEAHSEAGRRVQSIERMARFTKTWESSDLQPVLADVVRENPNQIAWIRIFGRDGHIVAAAGRVDEAPKYSARELQIARQEHRPRRYETASQQSVLSVIGPFLLPSSEDQSPTLSGGPAKPESIEIAMYPKGISVNFGPLQQNLIVELSAALALLGAAIAIGFLFRDYVRGKQVEQELALARRVQLDLFPVEGSVITQIQFAARCVPAREVGGDLYDVFDTGSNETALILGDVSGKGLPAALLMGLVQGAVRASCARGATSSEYAAEQLNNFLCAKTARERFVTLFWSSFNADTGVLRYINAGHCPALLIRGRAQSTGILRLEPGGPVLGVLTNARYMHGEVKIQAGDLLAIFSDGILEATDVSDEEFGEERLISAIRRNWDKAPDDICRGILADVSTFLGSQKAQDDQTLVIARLEPSYSEQDVSAEAESVLEPQFARV